MPEQSKMDIQITSAGNRHTATARRDGKVIAAAAGASPQEASDILAALLKEIGV